MAEDDPHTQERFRQESRTLGEVGHCQVALSVHAVSDVASCPLDCRLFLGSEAPTARCTACNGALRWRESTNSQIGGWHRRWWSRTPTSATCSPGAAFAVRASAKATAYPLDAVPHQLPYYPGLGPTPRRATGSARSRCANTSWR